VPRNNRNTRKAEHLLQEETEADLRLEIARSSLRRTVTKRGVDYVVQTNSGASTEPNKTWVCPNCNVLISVGTAHVVAWDAVRGVETRRHFHSQCFNAFQGELL
jgi:ABC-type branched-subunit amino acid transport system substrate-binding protein